jgi:hypothetical protein
MCYSSSSFIGLHYSLRCDGTPNDLDCPTSTLRSHELTDYFIREKWDPGVLWDTYGVRIDVVVCLDFPCTQVLPMLL